MTTITTILPHEAADILARYEVGDESIKSLPYRQLDAAGETAVREFVLANAKDPARVDLDAWIAAANHACCDALATEDVILEMGMQHTRSGNPTTINLTRFAAWHKAA